MSRQFNVVAYLKLLRPKDWAKNLFLFIPLFFGREIFNIPKLVSVFYGFIAFSCIASSIYIINDYRDREDDRKHPVKCKRPLASGAVAPSVALVICGLLLIAGFGLAWWLRDKFLFVVAIYFLINLAYSLGLKSIAILDIMILALGCAVIVVAYLMYTTSEETIKRMGSSRLYYTCIFVLAGIMRYLSIIYVSADSGSPTKILYKDRFIQITLLLWIASFILILYSKNVTLFK